MKKFIMLVIASIFLVHAQATSSQAKLMLLDYEDFGPQAMAYKLIGYAWYQWENHGSSQPSQTYPVKVIIYKDMTLNEVKSQYPVIVGEQDYRYLPYRKAIRYLNESETDPLVQKIPTLIEKIKNTKKKIAEQLGK